MMDVEDNRFRAVPLEGTEQVDVDTVDNFLQNMSLGRVDLLKVDTQGFDLEVLRGAQQSLSSGVIQFVLVELNFVSMYVGQNSPQEVIELLAESGLILVDFYEKVRQGGPIGWCTALFGRR